MQVSKIFLQPKIHFGTQATPPNQNSQTQHSHRNGDVAASLDALASIGKSLVNSPEYAELDEKNDKGNLIHTRRVDNGQIIDTYYNANEKVSHRFIKSVSVIGHPEDQSRTEIYYWEDGRNESEIFTYNKDGKLIATDLYDRPVPPDDDGSPYADFIL